MLTYDAMSGRLQARIKSAHINWFLVEVLNVFIADSQSERLYIYAPDTPLNNNRLLMTQEVVKKNHSRS